MDHANSHRFRFTRRRLLAGTAAMAGLAVLQPAASANVVAEAEGLIGSLSRLRWDWTVEQLALARINTDRIGALGLLKAALAIDLDPKAAWRRKRAVRLYDLFAAAATPGQRLDLADLVLASPRSSPALHARARLWADPERPPRARLWRTTDASGEPIGILIDPA